MKKSLFCLAFCLLLPGMLAGKEIPARELPGRATVAITASRPQVDDTPAASFYGTGSVISPLGYVLTSTTVVPPNCNEINIVSPGHYQLQGELVKADETTELSLIRVSPPAGVPFPHFEMRKSASVELGEVVITVANSFQSATRAGELTTSVGLMSGRYGVARSLAEQPVYLGEVVETTAATNPGSDGGPLLDGSGRVIGVLSLNVSDARWLGVAVPIEVMLEDLRTAIRNDLEQRGLEVPEELLPAVTSAGTPIFPEWEERSATFRSVVKSVQESVVAIQVDREKDDPRFVPRRQRGSGSPTGRARILAELHSRPDGATVTGVIVDPDGWIATSYFNIAGELNSIRVVLADGRELEAEVVGWDQERDLALLKVAEGGLPAIEMNPDVALGDYVCAIGRSPSPKALTLTTGIVSAIGRGPNELLQFDAAANVGNTGGALVGLDGRCVGIIGGISTRSRHGQNSGIAFATGAEKWVQAFERMKQGEKITRRPRPTLGVICAPGAVDLEGVLIARVRDGSPADQAGLRRNDSILAVDGVPVEGEADLANLIRSKNMGDRVTLTVRRLARRMEIEVTLGEEE